MIVVMLGATAVGKSALAVALARHWIAAGRPAEIVNADSMLVYRGMDIGTAKPSLAERQGVSHHLVDILDVSQTATVAEFQQLARAAIDDCLQRGVLPIVVGGSALYIRAIVDDFVFPGTDPVLRARLAADLDRLGPLELHARLREHDPAAAAVIEPGNGRRTVRALEVIELTGAPFTASLPPFHYRLPDVVQVGLRVPRAELDHRITERVIKMWQAGLVEEVRQLVDRGLAEGLTASRALGYRQVLDFLAGRLSEDQAQDLTIRATRKFARRQDSWFRKDPRVVWLDAGVDDLLHQISTVIEEATVVD